MFKNDEKGGNFKEVETVIGPSVKVKGNFNGQGNIVVEGILEGNLKTKGNVLVGESAKITGNVEAQNLKVGGEVNGNVKIEGYLEVASSAKIDGEINCASVSIEKGATLNGKFNMTALAIENKEPSKEEK